MSAWELAGRSSRRMAETAMPGPCETCQVRRTVTKAKARASLPTRSPNQPGPDDGMLSSLRFFPPPLPQLPRADAARAMVVPQLMQLSAMKRHRSFPESTLRAKWSASLESVCR